MNEQTNNEIISWINKLRIRDELKQELIYFNEKITKIKITECKLNFNVIIDERSNEDINILLEYITNILEQQELYKNFISYNNKTEIEKIFDSVIIVNDFKILNDRILDNYHAERDFSDFLNNIKKNNNMLIITCTNKITDNLKKIKKEVFNPELCIYLKRNSNYELYKELIKLYNDNSIKHNLSYNSFLKLLNSIKNDKYNIYSIDYLYDYSVKKMILNSSNIINTKTFKDLITIDSNKKKKRKEELIGLDNIKQELDSLYKYLKYIKKNKIKDDLYLNLFFLGNPGTGKTTVARKYAEKLYKLGVIKENKLIETIPTELIGEYVGQTKESIRKVLKEAQGGVLFIDEAYLLYSNNYSKGNNPYMEEAIVELIKYLEDPKNIVIFAGYPKEMKKIYNANPGIKSRIYKEIVFDDYSNLELYQILEKNINKKKLTIDIKSKNKIIKYINELKKDNNFGNARSMIQLSQKMIINHVNNNEKELLINAKDLPKININNNKIKMGFGIYD